MDMSINVAPAFTTFMIFSRFFPSFQFNCSYNKANDILSHMITLNIKKDNVMIDKIRPTEYK